MRPAVGDNASVARTLFVPCEKYDERWDEIAGVFSKEAILQGSFDRYADSTKAKKGTAEVDKAFLGEIEGWRDALARNIALRNPGLSQRELNYAVQTTIDRIIFLRICEDRGIEAYGRLRGLCNGGGTYGRLRQLFFEADARYNSGLFHFEDERGRASYADRLTPGLTIDDRVLKDILKHLYYPESPYEFSVLPADILGQVYEQFLGKVIRLTAGHRAVVEDKPAVKKAGGVYYTPTYIVDYIVKQTVGRLLEGKTPKQAAALRILDPACGSGSFLIGAYQYLLDWHRDWYVADATGSAKKHVKALYQGRGGEWRLTTAEKKRILQSSVYGVDIRDSAVSPSCKPMVSGRELHRYRLEWSGRYVEYGLADQMYGARSPDFFEQPKLMIRDITGTHRLETTVDEAGFYCDHTILCAHRAVDIDSSRLASRAAIDASALYSLCVLQGLVASRLVSAYYYFVLSGEGVRTGGGLHTYPTTVRRLPVFDVSQATESKSGLLSRVGEMAAQLLVWKSDLRRATTPQHAAHLARACDTADRTIDHFVYQLYDLSDGEIELVEAST